MKAIDALNDFANNGNLLHYISVMDLEKNTVSLGNCIFAIIQFNPEIKDLKPIGSSADGVIKINQILKSPIKYPKIIKSFATQLVDFKKTDLIFKIPKEYPIYKDFMQYVFMALESTVNLTKYVNSEQLILNEPFIFETLDQEAYDKLINKYIIEDDLIKALLTNDFQISLISLYTSIFKSLKIDSDFNTYILSGLNRISKAEWKEEQNSIEELPNLYSFTLELIDNNIKTNLQTSFLDTLSDYLSTYRDETKRIGYIDQNWSKFLLALGESQRDTLISDLRDQLINSSLSFSEFLLLFGEDINKCEILSKKADELIRIAFKNFLERNDIVELNWMNSIFTKCPQILKECEVYSLDSFKDRIKEHLENNILEEEVFKSLTETANILSIKWVPKKNEEEGSEEIEVNGDKK